MPEAGGYRAIPEKMDKCFFFNLEKTAKVVVFCRLLSFVVVCCRLFVVLLSFVVFCRFVVVVVVVVVRVLVVPLWADYMACFSPS